jgi:flagellar biosynthesis protein FlhB
VRIVTSLLFVFDSKIKTKKKRKKLSSKRVNASHQVKRTQFLAPFYLFLCSFSLIFLTSLLNFIRIDENEELTADQAKIFKDEVLQWQENAKTINTACLSSFGVCGAAFMFSFFSYKFGHRFSRKEVLEESLMNDHGPESISTNA